MPASDIHISSVETGVLHLKKGRHYQVTEQDICALYIPESAAIDIALEGEEFVRIEPGDVITVLGGHEHTIRLADEPRQARILVEFPLSRATKECSNSYRVFAACHPSAAMPLPGILPNLTHFNASEIDSYLPLKSTLRTVRELASNRIETGNAVYNRMVEALALVLMERTLKKLDETGITAGGAVHDVRLREAIGAMHESPSYGWTLDILASRAGLSRSIFAENFRETTGQTPYQYLTRLRINSATKLLGRRNLSITEIAWRSGYQSDSSFIKAFRRVEGISPGEYRRRNFAGF